MKKILQVIFWEFKRSALTKGWLLSLLVIPVVLYLIFHLQLFFTQQPDVTAKYLVGVLDLEQEGRVTLSPPQLPDNKSQILFIRIDNQKRTHEQAKELGFTMIQERRLDGLLIVSPDTLHPLQYYTQTFPDESFYNLLQSELVKAQILDETRSNAKELEELVIMPEIKILRFDEKQLPFEFEPEKALRSITNYSLLFFIALSFIAGIVIRSFQEEKSNKLIEVLLSSASIRELIIGKYIAFILLSIIQTAFWVFITWLGNVYFGVAELSLTELLSVIGCFIAGLFFFVSLYLYIGSRILKETSMQFVLTFLSLVIFLPLLFSQRLIFGGEIGIVSELGFVPIFTPITSLLQITAKSVNPIHLWQQNILLLVWSAALLLPLVKSVYNPFGMFGKSSKRPSAGSQK